MDNNSKIPSLYNSVRKKKTDLHINEIIATRSLSPCSSKITPKVQKIQQYRTTLPVRTGRLLNRSRAATPESPLVGDGSRATSTQVPSAVTGTPDDALRLDRGTHGSMLHDIVTMKTMLLKLKRVLQEPDEEQNLMRTDTLNPLDSQRDNCSLKNGPSLRLGEIGEASPPPPPPAPHEEVADLRRQLVFLQSQLEDRERLVKLLQQQMSKYSEQSNNSEHSKNVGLSNSNEDTCNVATQTERLRTTNGSNILQGLNSDPHPPGSIVSWNEQIENRSVQSMYNLRESSSSPQPPVKNYTLINLNGSSMNGDCDVIKNNKINSVVHGYSNNTQKRESSPKFSDTELPVYMKSSCKVGTRYLQAIANQQNNNGYSNDKYSVKNKPLYTRSKSIENLKSNNLHTNLVEFNEKGDSNKISDFYDKSLPGSNESIKKHTSYTNLYDNTINGGNYINGYKIKKNGYSNGNITDTDDSFDNGYKSLPPSVNLPYNKLNNIPRRTLNLELNTNMKQAQINQY